MHMSTQNGCSLATLLIETESRNTQANSKKKHGSDGKRWPLTPFPFLAPWPSRPPSHRDAATPSPCWAPHFMTQECIIFSNPTPSEPRLSPAATMSDDMLSALTPPFHCAFILQPATPPQVVAFESQTICAPICLNRFTFAESQKFDL